MERVKRNSATLTGKRIPLAKRKSKTLARARKAAKEEKKKFKKDRLIHGDKRNHLGGPLFAEGNKANPAGRPKGKPNTITTVLKDAIITAAELVGEDRKGKGGLVGYLKGLAKYEPRTFGALLGRVIPLHVVATHDHNHKVLRSKEEIREELKSRGLDIESIFPARLTDRKKNLELTAKDVTPNAPSSSRRQ
jgi:hypothetical protein